MEVIGSAEKMSIIIKELLSSPVQMADRLIKLADEAQTFRMECLELKGKTEKLLDLLRHAARVGDDLYERPTRRIIDDTEQALEKALQLVGKCCGNGLMKRLFTIIPATAFRKTSMQLENSLGDVQWLLRVSISAAERDDEYLGLPPIATNEPILCLIWEQIAILLTGGSMEDRSDAAASLVSLARDNDRYNKLIIEEGGVPPLLKLLKEGHLEGQENAARAIGLLGKDPESVEQIVNAGVCAVFAKILKEGDMKVQSMVAWAISEFAYHHPKCQDHFAQNNCIRLLVRHLAFETIQEHSKYTIASKHSMSSIHSVVLASNAQNQNHHPDHDKKTSMHEDEQHQLSRPSENNQPSSQMHSLVTNTMAMKQQASGKVKHGHAHVSIASGTSMKGREAVEPVIKAQMKAMAAKALWQLSKGNVTICRSITESRALLCFAVLLDKGPDDVKSFSAFALMEITAVAEQHVELRRSAFKPNSPAAKAVVDQLLRIIGKGGSDLIIPCIRSMGHLARTFRATETRIIPPLVGLLDESESDDVKMEATIALIKFACTENFLHETHCSAMIEAGGARHLIQLGHSDEPMMRTAALRLLSYVAMHLPKIVALAHGQVISVLEEGAKLADFIRDPTLEELMREAVEILRLYQSGATG